MFSFCPVSRKAGGGEGPPVLLQGSPHGPSALCGVSLGCPEGQQLHQLMEATLPGSCPDFTSDTFHTSRGNSLQEVGSGPLHPCHLGSLLCEDSLVLGSQREGPHGGAVNSQPHLAPTLAQDNLHSRAFCASRPNRQGHRPKLWTSRGRDTVSPSGPVQTPDPSTQEQGAVVMSH